MKLKIFTFLLIAVAGLSSCRKDVQDIDIKQYDEQQIQNWIASNSLTGFVRDTTGGDTTGMYYKIINPGTGAQLEYSDQIALVFTLKSFDGKYTSADTIANHFYDYLGHLTQDGLPKGLQSAIHNLLKYKGASMRLLIPSRLAYGKSGYGSGSITNVNTRIAGNQSLEYYVHVIDKQADYDDLVIRNFITANSLTGYLKTASGVYYKTVTPGTGTIGEINDLSVVTATYTGALLNGTAFDEASKTTAYTFTPVSSDGIAGLIKGVQEGLKEHAAAGTSISLLIPSGLGYGNVAQSTGLIPAFSPLKFEFQITTVTSL
ncbi:FKBP-type peptidyl-prolyl cis-trans isomerase [Mucilaginibacter pedocola]|uniref:Peptidyl-prolyl cis-trans isomerase n=1 Tax=Mucilaginibacter pedocola TaxID=1792845 RepID=A0A1S9PBA7_9SPHI|nr:FKBP-type peptidyl-prolyl cis-trans isomerase [Mucilaginibacter pedocola]OOQ58240.1 hypothetical protein BC343_11395 [Mucilaginibacter pedocola]